MPTFWHSDLTAAFTAQDFDQDPLALPAGTLLVNVENDVPTAEVGRPAGD